MQRRRGALIKVPIVVLVLLTTFASATGQSEPGARSSDPQGRNMTNAKDGKKESPFACNIFGLTAEQRQRHAQLVKRLKSARQEIRELADGYELRFNVEPATVQELAEFMIYERRCCPFFDLELVLEREDGPAWLRLRGRQGVKEFIRTEFGFK